MLLFLATSVLGGRPAPEVSLILLDFLERYRTIEPSRHATTVPLNAYNVAAAPRLSAIHN